MAPEQVRGELVGASADVWALGALGFFAATGRPPFGEGTEAALLYRLLHETPNVSGCPPQVAGIIGRCLNRDPAARPSPGQVIAGCREQTAGQAGGSAPWLPPEVLAGLAQHAPPPALLSPPASVSQGFQSPQAAQATQTSGGWQAPWAPLTHASTAPVTPATAAASPAWQRAGDLLGEAGVAPGRTPSAGE